jgi:hypothetical protein
MKLPSKGPNVHINVKQAGRGPCQAYLLTIPAAMASACQHHHMFRDMFSRGEPCTCKALERSAVSNSHCAPHDAGKCLLLFREARHPNVSTDDASCAANQNSR